MRRRMETVLGMSVVTLSLMAVAMVSHGIAAQSEPDSADLQVLQEELFDLQRQVDRLRQADVRDTSRVQLEVDTLRDELTYLRVKLRKEGEIEPAEVETLESQLASLRRRVDNEPTTYTRDRSSTADRDDTDRDRARVPVNTEIDVRLQTSLNSDRARVEDEVSATTVTDLSDTTLLIPAGSVIRGHVSAVDRSSRTDRTASLTLIFDELVVEGVAYPATLTVAEALESGGLRDEAGRAGVGAGLGGLIGGLLGGARGALAGILIGGGGTVMATEGEDVDLPAGSVLRLRFDAPLYIDPLRNR